MVSQNEETSRQHRESAKKSHQTAPRNISPVIDRLLTLGLPSLKYRRERTDVIQLFKITHGFDTVSISSTCPICNNPMFKPSLATQTRGHPYKFQVQHTSGPRRNFFSTRVLDNWNKLSTETVTSTTLICSNRGLPRSGTTNQTYISISSHINISISQLQTK